MQIRVAPRRPSPLAYFQYAARLRPCGTRVAFETCRNLRLGELVYPTVCIAGGVAPRSPRPELRVQLGAFDDSRHADARVAQLRRAGVPAEVWLAPDLSRDTDRLLVVTRARFATLSAARHTVDALRRHGVAAFARRFAVDRG